MRNLRRLPSLLALLTAAVAHAEEAAPAPASAPAAAVPEAKVERSAYDLAVELFVRGDFARARDAFDAVLAAPTSNDEAARARALRDLAERYVKTGARLTFPKSTVDAAKGPTDLPDERTDDEIVSYYLTSIPYGIGVGTYLSLLARADSAAGLVFPILGAVGVTAGAMAYADHAQTRPYGEPQALVSGALIGLQVAIPTVALTDTTSNKETLGIVLAGATLGGAAGLYANHRWATTPGEMSFVGSTALWANVLGMLGGVVANASDKDFAPISLTMVGLGTAVGAAYTRDFAPSIARVRYLDFGAIVGGLTLGGTYAALAGSAGNGETAAALAGVGILGGAGLAVYLTREMHRDEPRRATALQWMPTVAPTTGGATVGVAGTF